MGERRRARDPLGCRPVRAGPGQGCRQNKGAPERPGHGSPGQGTECAPVAGGPGAAGRVLFSPSVTDASGLGWVPRSSDQGGGGGPGGATRCWKVAGLSCGGTRRAGISCRQGGYPPPPASSSATFLPTSPPMDGKFVEAGVRKCPLFLGGCSIYAKIIDP